MTDQTYVGATDEQLRSPMVQELLSVHAMFRNQLQAMMDYIDDLTSGEYPLDTPQTRDRIQALIRAGTQYTQMLHGHHHGETEMLFPPLQKQGLEQSIVDKLNADHDELGVMIDQFNDAVHHFATVDPTVMNHDLRRLSDALRDHLDYEETHVCPLLARWTQWPMTH